MFEDEYLVVVGVFHLQLHASATLYGIIQHVLS
jgi:hypothetical protein